MPLTKEFIKTTADFDSTMEKFSGQDNVYVLFCGEKDNDGNSWCPDCVKAEPFINEAITEGTLITCEIIRSEYRQNPEYPYRKHSKINLTGIPTLIKWGTSQRLADDQCANKELLAMLTE